MSETAEAPQIKYCLGVLDRHLLVLIISYLQCFLLLFWCPTSVNSLLVDILALLQSEGKTLEWLQLLRHVLPI